MFIYTRYLVTQSSFRITLINTGSTLIGRILSCIEARLLEDLHLVRDIRRDEGLLYEYLRLLEAIWTFTSLTTLDLEWMHPLKGKEQHLETVYDGLDLRKLELQGGTLPSFQLQSKPTLHTLYLPLMTFTVPGTMMKILEQDLLSATPYLRHISLASQIPSRYHFYHFYRTSHFLNNSISLKHPPCPLRTIQCSRADQTFLYGLPFPN
jgi:hypothetical protein